MFINSSDPNELISAHQPKRIESPIKDFLKESQFHPDLLSFISTNCHIREDDTYSVEFFMQYGTRTPPTEIYLSNWTESAEILEFLKNLHNSTFNLIKFIEKHNLSSKVRAV
jgi:hypothetical protein